MARRAAYIKNHFGEYDDPNLIHLDTGSFSNFFSQSGIVKTKALIELHDLMQLDAVNITARELAADPQIILSAIQGKTAPYISANIVKENGEKLLPAYVTLNTRQGEIAVVGIATPTGKTWQSKKDGQISILPPAQALGKLLPELEDKTIILLTDLPRRKLGKLLQEVPQIALALGGDGYSLINDKTSGVPFSYAGKQGQYLGTMNIELENRRIKRTNHKLILMNEAVPEAPEVKRVVDNALKLVQDPEAGMSKHIASDR